MKCSYIIKVKYTISSQAKKYYYFFFYFLKVAIVLKKYLIYDLLIYTQKHMRDWDDTHEGLGRYADWNHKYFERLYIYILMLIKTVMQCKGKKQRQCERGWKNSSKKPFNVKGKHSSKELRNIKLAVGEDGWNIKQQQNEWHQNFWSSTMYTCILRKLHDTVLDWSWKLNKELIFTLDKSKGWNYYSVNVGFP